MAPRKGSHLLPRRAESVFSRRGGSTPLNDGDTAQASSMPRFIADEIYKSPIKRTFSRRLAITRQLSGSSHKHSATSPHMVRGVDNLTISLPLETAMLTLPNEEILGAIDDRPSLNSAYPSSDVVPTLAALYDAKSTPDSGSREQKFDSRVDTWREDVNRHSNSVETIVTHTENEEEKPDAQGGDATLRWPTRHSVHQAQPIHSPRPALAVRVPSSQRGVLVHNRKPSTEKVPLLQVPFICPELTEKTPTQANSSLGSDDPLTAIPITPKPRPRQESSSSNSIYTSHSDTEYASSYRSEESPRTSMDSEITRPSTDLYQVANKNLRQRADSDTSNTSKDSDYSLNKSLPPTPQTTSSGSSCYSKTPPRPRRSHYTRSPASYPKRPRHFEKMHIRPSASCRSLDKLNNLDDAFLKTDPYASSGSSSPSPTLTEAVSDLVETLQRIPGRKRSNSAQSCPRSVQNMQGITNALRQIVPDLEARPTLSRAPTIPEKSDKRDGTAVGIESAIDSLGMPSQGGSTPMTESKARAAARRRSLTCTQLISEYLDISALSGISSSPTRHPTVPSPVATPVSPQNQPIENHGDRSELPLAVAAGSSAATQLTQTKRNAIDQSAYLSTFSSDINTPDKEKQPRKAPPHNIEQLEKSRPGKVESTDDSLLLSMSALDSLKDLEKMARSTKDMYQVYKQNELSLLKTVCKNKSFPLWELREWSSPLGAVISPEESVELEYTPDLYIKSITHDTRVVGKLRQLIVLRCASFVRSETLEAFSSGDRRAFQRYENALYRIWCFCKIFGGNKRREEDIAGQLDWLKGGLLAHQDDCAATTSTNLACEFGSVLATAPEHFGLCNQDGLSADELFDMTEMWNCLSTLMQSYVGKIDHARTNGVYCKTDIKYGDVRHEEIMLEEWIYYVMSHGPDAILKLAELSDHVSAGFSLAHNHGWMKWTPPVEGTSRSSFFREPVARLYEERITETIRDQSRYSWLSRSEQDEHKRLRTAQLAQEIKLARHASSYPRLPFIDMAHERPMSTMSMFYSSFDAANRVPGNASALTAMALPAPAISSETIMPPVAFIAGPLDMENRSPQAQRTRSPPLQQWKQAQGQQSISPIEEERTPVGAINHLGPFNVTIVQTSTYENVTTPRSRGAGCNDLRMRRVGRQAVPIRTSSKKGKSNNYAVMSIVEQGFSARQAAEALKMTDTGDNVRLAIDMLVQQELVARGR